MSFALRSLFFTLVLAMPLAHAQNDVQPTSNQAQWLSSPNAKLAANKRLVYDFWREVLEAGHLEKADHYLSPSYIQHNPNVPTGRDGFVDYFSRFAKPHAVNPAIEAPLVNILAEGDLVVLSFVQPQKDGAGAAYSTTWFDMFRIENGQIAEHWDPSVKQATTATQSEPAEPRQYVGSYPVQTITPDEAVPKNMRIEVSLHNGKLMLNLTGEGVTTNGSTVLSPAGEDSFVDPDGSTLAFRRGADRHIEGVTLAAGGYTFKANTR
jgi:predicted SnoaL-like aldol condensation-catalyzing enzyme